MGWQRSGSYGAILPLFMAGLLVFYAWGVDLVWAAEPKQGGTIRVGTIGEPPTLDAHWTTASITEILANHYAEGLYTLDDQYQPIPMLAESHAVSEDGLIWTFKLRQGILFHNDKEMTSEDVVASLDRWGQMSAYGKTLYGQIKEVKALDKYTVQMTLKEPSGIVLISLGTRNNFGAIYPKELVEQYGTEKMKDYIGTGPFRVVDWKPDRYIQMTRWEKYTPRAEPANGFGGKKMAYVDEVRFMPIPDVSVRVASLETGEIDFGDDINPDAYARVKDNPQLEVRIAQPYYWIVAVFNKKKGLFTNPKMRQAVQAAINIEPVMKAAGGEQRFYRLDSSLAFQEQAQWWTDAGREYYNLHDKEKAKQLLKEAGYQGEPFRFMTTQEYDWMYKAALVTKQQLEEIGITVDLQVVDWSTLVQRRNNPDLYDAFTTGMGMFYDPTHHIYLRCHWPGWTCDEDFDKLLGQMMVEQDYQKRYALWQEVHRLFYQEKVPVIRYGDLFAIRVMQKHLKNVQNLMRPFFWNVWIDKSS